MTAALELSQDRLADLTKFAKQLTEKQNDVNSAITDKFHLRFIDFFQDLDSGCSPKCFKEKVRSDMTKSLYRADRAQHFSRPTAFKSDYKRIVQVIARSYDWKLSGKETKLLATVKEYRTRMLGYAMEMSKLSLQAAELQREARGPARPFTASIGASIFVLQHGEEELVALKRRLESLSARLGSPLCDGEKNKENINSRQ